METSMDQTDTKFKMETDQMDGAEGSGSQKGGSQRGSQNAAQSSSQSSTHSVNIFQSSSQGSTHSLPPDDPRECVKKVLNPDKPDHSVICNVLDFLAAEGHSVRSNKSLYRINFF